MIVTPDPTFDIEHLCLSRSGEDRSPGLHHSDVVKSIMEDIDPATYLSGNPMDMKAVEIGFTFEVVLEDAFKSRRTDIMRIGEVEKDGISLSPDGLDPGDPPVLHEFKSTAKSCRLTPWPCELHLATGINPDCRMCSHEFGPKYLAWLLQIKSYCHVLEVKDACLTALFLRGDYGKGDSGRYQLRRWNMRFTEEELQKHWALILKQVEKKGLRHA